MLIVIFYITLYIVWGICVPTAEYVFILLWRQCYVTPSIEYDGSGGW